MRVAGDLEIDAVFCRHISVVRFVHGENSAFAFWNVAQCCIEIGTPIQSIFQTCQPQPRAARLNCNRTVVQDPGSMCLEGFRHRVEICFNVMIAMYGESPIGSLYSGQNLRAGPGALGGLRMRTGEGNSCEVTCGDQQIGLYRIDQLNGLLKMPFMRELPEMYVAELGQAEAFERFGQPWQANLNVVEFDLVRFIECYAGGGNRRCAKDAGRGLEKCASRDMQS